MTNEAADILRKAKELIETKGWTQGPLARTALGQGTSPYDKDAACFCSLGAILRSEPVEECSVAARKVFAKAIRVRGIQYIGRWNDTTGRSKSAVLSAFDRAIALAEAGK